eukprot:s106_g39.t1
MQEGAFPLTIESMTTLAAVLDATGMKAGDQYLAEAKSMHVESGYEWDLQMERQMSSCKRAMQRDKGPEHRARELRVEDISENEWLKVNQNEKEPKRVAWSYCWATLWMLRAIEAANVKAKDVVVKVEEKIVRCHIRKSKTDQKGAGSWRTLSCCGNSPCQRSCAFNLAIMALNDLDNAEKESALFPDGRGNEVSKIHMVTSWAGHLQEEVTGHPARRSGAMAYARAGLEVQSIQFLGRWKSSAVVRYIEEALTELPMNTRVKTPGTNDEGNEDQTKATRRALRPKAKASPAVGETKKEAPSVEVKPLVNNEGEGPVYAVSKTRGNWTKHIVGQAAWGIPLDSWATLCGWNFARRNVKVELTRRPTRLASVCKKCEKFAKERDGVKGAREWAHNMSWDGSDRKRLRADESQQGQTVEYLDLRVEVQWQKEAFDSGRLVAKCPGCSFLVLCNEQEDQGELRCLYLLSAVKRKVGDAEWNYAHCSSLGVLALRMPKIKVVVQHLQHRWHDVVGEHIQKNLGIELVKHLCFTPAVRIAAAVPAEIPEACKWCHRLHQFSAKAGQVSTHHYQNW